jgi:phosphoserine phosphatase RsbU/P
MSILVVDDNEDVRELFEAVLAEDGYLEVTTVESAAAAFSYLMLDAPSSAINPPVDLVLLDVVMPGVDGIEACARIRCDPRYSDIPIVMTTSLDDIGSVDRAFKCGATGYLTKPLKAVDLLACVRSTLKIKAEFDRRTAHERELVQHAPLCFDSLN